MTRRIFSFASLAAVAAAQTARTAPTRRKILIVLLDGFGPEYLEASDMPNLKRMGREGFLKIRNSVIPSVTNVNNASLITASFPIDDGITTNYQYDPQTKMSSEMESAEFVLKPTLFEKAAKLGWKRALVSSKEKVRTLCSRGADIALSAEKPEPVWVDRAGKKENMYTAEVNYWTFRAARHILKNESVALLYLSTTDYMMHTFAPREAPSLQHLQTLDKMLGDIVDDHPKIELYLTADHGMNAKSEAIDPAILLRAKSVQAEAIPIIRDAHKAHHNNLGGACYIYLEKIGDKNKVIEILTSTEGVEEVFTAQQAVKEFHLHPGRIGDLFILGKKECAFGQLDRSRETTKVRSHGSRNEAKVPLLVYGAKVDPGRYGYNVDLTRNLNLKA